MKRCEVIHVAIICAGYDASRAVATLVKSLLFYRKNPIHMHFVADIIAKNVLETLFYSWDIPHSMSLVNRNSIFYKHFLIFLSIAVNYSFYSAENLTTDVAWIPNKHYSGVFGLLKLTLPKVLPESLDRVIVLDCDVTFSSDIADLWEIFSLFSPEQVINLNTVSHANILNLHFYQRRLV